jgi:cytochrome c
MAMCYRTVAFAGPALGRADLSWRQPRRILVKQMPIVWVTLIALACSGPVLASEAMAKADGCLNCHAIDSKKVGPSFKDVAAKYKGKADAEQTLVTKITSGKGHPASKASPADVKTIVQWVLAQ